MNLVNTAANIYIYIFAALYIYIYIYIGKSGPLLHRAFRRIALIINQQMHCIKFHIKILKIAPTCFDPKIILRELRCSLLKSF
jgi:hypothetical protein